MRLTVFRSVLCVLALCVLIPQAVHAAPTDLVDTADEYAVPNGRFYRQAGGFTITDDAGIPFWSEFQRLGGVAVLGFPVSGRYEADGLVMQAVQRGILQWRPDQRHVVLTNVLDDLSRAGRDDWLLHARQTPKPLAPGFDQGVAWDEVVKRRQALLDADSAIRARYFAAADPLNFFGLPTSPVTDMGNHTAMRFQRTVIQHWKIDVPWAKAGEVTLANAGDLAKQAGLIAPVALEPHSPAIEGQAERIPWSGWWWPADEGVRGPHLFDADGPLERYDSLNRARGLAVPSVRDWEAANLRLLGGAYPWAGHCNGWAAASILEPEPTAPRTIDGVTFSVADQKGLLAGWHFGDGAAWSYGDDHNGVEPADFHRMLLNWLGERRQSFVVNAFVGSNQVFNFPAYRFRILYSPDATDPNRTHVRATVWFVDYDVPADFVGVKDWPNASGKTYEYVIIGDRSNPVGGEWEGASASGERFSRPWQIWYPDGSARNVSRPLVSPDLDYSTIKAIVEPLHPPGAAATPTPTSGQPTQHPPPAPPPRR